MTKKEEELQRQQEEEDIRRVKLPRGNQVLGVIDQRLGASRMRVRCFDGKSRICRIPGRMKRKLWVREDDLVLIEPWEYDAAKGDVIFKYKQTQVGWLRRKGYVKDLETSQEF